MFNFLSSKKVKTAKETEEEQVLSALSASLSGESKETTILKNRLRIIDLEDKVVKIEKELKKFNLYKSPRGYAIKPRKKLINICLEKPKGK